MTFQQEFLQALEAGATHPALLALVEAHQKTGVSLNELYDQLYEVWVRYGFDRDLTESQIRDELESVMERLWYQRPRGERPMAKLYTVEKVALTPTGLALRPGVLVDAVSNTNVAGIQQGTPLGIRLPNGKVIYTVVADYFVEVTDPAFDPNELTNSRIVIVVPSTLLTNTICPRSEVWL